MEKNDNGYGLVQLAQANGLRAANALAKRHLRRLSTWWSPDGACSNMIGYFVVPQRWISRCPASGSVGSIQAVTRILIIHWWGCKFADQQ